MVGGRFRGGEVTNLLFNYFEGSNEGIVGRKAEMTGSIVKCGERLLEGGGCEISVRLLPMITNDCAMETMEYMFQVGRYLVHARLDYVKHPDKNYLWPCKAL